MGPCGWRGQPDEVPLSLSTLLSPSGTESRQRERGREEAPSGSNMRDPSVENSRVTSESDVSYPSGANGIAPSVSPSEVEGDDWIGCSLLVELGQL